MTDRPFRFLHVLANLAWSVFFQLSHSNRCVGYLVVVSACISLIINGVEYLFICLSAPHALFWYFFQSLGPFLCYVLLMLNFEILYKFWLEVFGQMCDLQIFSYSGDSLNSII